MRNKMLVTGNGFDLYHGLPTRYTDFLAFSEYWSVFEKAYDETMTDDGQFDIPLSDRGKLIEDSMKEFAKHGGYNPEEIEYLKIHLGNNAWIKYFKQAGTLKEGWIDFEDEMLKALEKIEEFYEVYRPRLPHNKPASMDLKNSALVSTVRNFGTGKSGYDPELANGIVSDKKLSPEYLKEQKAIVINAMKEDMDCLNQCLRIYLSEFVSRVRIAKYSEQVKGIGICNVLNFNYTYTYKSVYDQREGGQNHAIHGELKENNLVLGIADDAFPDTRDYVFFTKYFQRLQKKTGAFYNEWINYEKCALDDLMTEVHVVGHSLGKSDEEILLMIFNSRNVEKIYIYYHSQSSYEDQIMNLVELLGRKRLVQENLSERIEFVELKKAVEK